MIYTPEEKMKMDAALRAFQSYVDLREDYDVLYSEKAGYLRVLVGEGCDSRFFPITGFAHMIRMFVNDFLMDEERRVNHYLKLDYDHVRRLLAPRLDTLGSYREEAREILEDTFEANRLECEQTRQTYLEEIPHLEKLLQDLRNSV